MEIPCVRVDSSNFWLFVVLALVAHARQTVLLMREVFAWCFATLKNRSQVKRTRRR